jgi:hypothetical protein
LRRIFVVWAAVLVVAFAATVVVRSWPQAVPIPNSRLVFDQPTSWHAADPARILDPSWAEEQKRRYPNDAPLIDDTVDAFRSGRIQYSAWIDFDADTSRADGWVDAAVSRRALAPGGLAADALETVTRQPVRVRPGTTALDIALRTGPAVRLDWSFDLLHADGVTEVVYVRAYRLVDEDAVVAVQLVTYGPHPDAVASFDSAAATFRRAR